MTVGNNAGDITLKAVAAIIQETICEHCICCRWGGEEFLILMRCDHDPMETAEHIRQAVEKTSICHEGQNMRVTLSVGIAVAEKLSKEQLSDFINCADKAMYASKARGKNQITFADFQEKVSSR